MFKGEKILKDATNSKTHRSSSIESDPDDINSNKRDRWFKYEESKDEFEIGLDNFIELERSKEMESQKEMHSTSNFLINNTNILTALNQNTTINLQTSKEQMLDDSKTLNVSFLNV